jgi:hypothetical protein
MPESVSPRPIEIFFSYAHKDEDLVGAVRGQLSLFDRQKLIRKWHDREIPPGGEFKGIIDTHLSSAEIILLFVSPDFFQSDYCYDIEMKTALERHGRGEARVVPIILRPSTWKDAPFADLNVLPKDGLPVTNWPNRDDACLNIAEGVMVVVQDLLSRNGSPAVETPPAPAAEDAATRRAKGLPPSAAAPEATAVRCNSDRCRSNDVDLEDTVQVTGLRQEGDRWIAKGIVQIDYSVEGHCRTCGRIFEVAKGAIPLKFPDLVCHDCGQNAYLEYNVKDLTQVPNGYEFSVEVRCGHCSRSLTFSRVLTSLVRTAAIELGLTGLKVTRTAQ